MSLINLYDIDGPESVDDIVAKNITTITLSDGESYIKGCLIERRPEDEASALFSDDGKGNVTCKLDGYAIVPLNNYVELLRSTVR